MPPGIPKDFLGNQKGFHFCVRACVRVYVCFLFLFFFMNIVKIGFHISSSSVDFAINQKKKKKAWILHDPYGC